MQHITPPQNNLFIPITHSLIIKELRKKAARNSAIELLKIVAIIGIILRHISGGIANPSVMHGFQTSLASWDLNHIFVQLTYFLGPIGNNIFWICSCWFLVGDNRMSKRKLFGMIVDVWLISIIILCFALYDLGDAIEKEHIKNSLFPTLFENNWFVTCYILMYAIHPLLNIIIKRLSQRGLFRTALSFAMLYIILSVLSPGHFFPSMPTIWTAVYFIVAYIKLYLDQPSKNIRFNIMCIALSSAAIICSVATLNYIGTHTSLYINNVLLWNCNENPFVIIFSISLFNLVRNYKFENKAVNYLAGLTLFIYLIHENLLLRTYYRPMIWNKIFDIDKYQHLILDCLLFTTLVFIGSVILSMAYSSLIKRPMASIISWSYERVKALYLRIESKLLNISMHDIKKQELGESTLAENINS